MERMDVDPCASAAGGVALRRSNSAPMITSVSDGSMVFSSQSSARFRRSSVSVNPSGPSQLLPLSPFPLTLDRPDNKRLEENMETTLRGSLQRLSASPAAAQWTHSNPWSPSHDSGVTPNSSPSPTRRFRPAVSAVRWPPLAPLKRKGGVESDGPPKKLFVAGVSEPHHHCISVSEAADDSPPLSAPPAFTTSSHQH